MSNFKKRLSVFAAMLALVSITGTAMAVTGADVVGQTSNTQVIDTSAKRTDINITSKKVGDVGQVDFSKFNVAKGEHVNYGFSAKSQTMINRVLGGEQSKIFGKMTNSGVGKDTGRVILINPAGVMFGAGSTVDLNSFTVSTFDFNGAKNLQDLSAEDITKYQSELTDKFSKNGITFNANDGLITGSGGITVEGGANIFADKELNFITNKNIEYTDSMLKTNGKMNVITADGVTFSGLSNNGSSSSYSTSIYLKGDKLTTDNNGNIIITNSTLEAGDLAINSQKGNINVSKSTLSKNTQSTEGNIELIANGTINIKDSKITGENKTDSEPITLVEVGADGSRYEEVVIGDNQPNLTVQGAKDVSIQNSIVDMGGKVRVTAKDNVKISAKSEITAGDDIEISSTDTKNTGSIVVENSKLNSRYRNIKFENKNGTTSFWNSKVNAKQDFNVASQGTAFIQNKSDIKGNNINIESSKGNINVLTNSTLDIGDNLAKDLKANKINLVSKEGHVNVKNSTLKGDAYGHPNGVGGAGVGSGASISSGKNTTIENSNINMKGNVEVKAEEHLAVKKSNITGSDIVTLIASQEGKKSGNLLVQDSTIKSEINVDSKATNGNIKFQNSKVKTFKFNAISKDTDSIQDGSEINATITNVKSQKGNVNLLNGSRIDTRTDIGLESRINLTAKEGYVNIKNSKIVGREFKQHNLPYTALPKHDTVEPDLNIVAGKSTTIENAPISMAGDINIKSDEHTRITTSDIDGKNINAVSDKGNILIEKKSNVYAKDSLALTSKESKVTVSGDSKAQGKYKKTIQEKNKIDVNIYYYQDNTKKDSPVADSTADTTSKTIEEAAKIDISKK